MLVGSNIASVPDIATTPAAILGSYPCFNIAGRLVEESVAAEAALDPQIAPKPAPASAVAMPSPPGTRPTQAAAALKRSSATPLTRTNSASNRNIGIVISSYELTVEIDDVSSMPNRAAVPPTR